MKLEDWNNVKLIDPVLSNKSAKEDRIRMYRTDFEYSLPLCDKNGLFLEFGVWKGRTINLCADILPDTTFYGFDSFEGLPEEWIIKNTNDLGIKKSKIVPKGHFALNSFPEVRNNVKLVKGFYNQSLVPWIEENLTDDSYISWLHLDADLYSSTIYILEKLNKYIVPGTIIRCDELVDWRLEGFKPDVKRDYAPKPKYSNWPEGEWKAINEWIEKYDREIQPLWREWHTGAGMKVIN